MNTAQVAKKGLLTARLSGGQDSEAVLPVPLQPLVMDLESVKEVPFLDRKADH
jgi:hypothetical protein